MAITDEQYDEWWERWRVIHHPEPLFVELIYNSSGLIHDFMEFFNRRDRHPNWAEPDFSSFAMYMNSVYVEWAGDFCG